MKIPSALAITLALAASACAEPATPATTPGRPAAWATPLKVEGLPNLHKVSDTLFRSAQPSEKGMQAIGSLKVKTVINLRAFHSDRDELGEVKSGYEHIHMKTWHPEREDAVRFLKIVTDPTKTPVLVHCQHGADRTGTLCAVYRIAVQGWSKEEALNEMTGGGYGYHKVWKNLPEWLNNLDVDALRKEAGLTPPDKSDRAPSAPSQG